MAEGTEIRRDGILFIVSGPSGAGKSSLADWALSNMEGITLSVSVTTRARRGDERDGVHYHFVGKERFEELRTGSELAEWAEVHGHCYGTPRTPIDAALTDGRDMLLDIDVQGAAQIKRSYPDAVTTFLLPPPLELLVERLSGRGTEEAATVNHRIENACRELSLLPDYDYVIVNDVLEETFASFRSVVRAERGRVERIREPDLERLMRAFGERP